MKILYNYLLYNNYLKIQLMGSSGCMPRKNKINPDVINPMIIAPNLFFAISFSIKLSYFYSIFVLITLTSFLFSSVIYVSLGLIFNYYLITKSYSNKNLKMLALF